MENSLLFRKPQFGVIIIQRYFNIVKMSFGDLSGEDTPGNIPNPVVKLTSADGTWGGTPWESKSLPKDFLYLTNERVQRRYLVLFPSII